MNHIVEAFPWRAVMAFGLGVLRLSPSSFWQTTPREMAAAMRAHSGQVSTPIKRRELQDLMAQFPDLSTEVNTNG